MISVFFLTGFAIWTNGPAHLPVFTLPDLNGKTWNSAASDTSRKVLVLDFWATWCSTCRETVPELVPLQKKYGAQDLRIVGISEDKGSAAKVARNGKALGVNDLILQDKEEALAKVFGFSGIPSLYVFDSTGELKLAMPGYDPDQENELIRALASLLK